MSYTFPYTVKQGDTGDHIAAAFDIAFDPALKNANPSVNWNDLHVGSQLHVPGWQYKVQRGDTGDALAQKDKIQFSALQLANQKAVWNDLQVGQVLNVPGKKNF